MLSNTFTRVPKGMQYPIRDWGKWLLCAHGWSGHLVGHLFLFVEGKRPTAMVSRKELQGTEPISPSPAPMLLYKENRFDYCPQQATFMVSNLCSHTGPPHLITMFFGCFEILFFFPFFQTFFFFFLNKDLLYSTGYPQNTRSSRLAPPYLSGNP